ncbi:SixA phosphatase family protein [Leucobacter soli]|uniref:Phosphohistidine phosphatase n=1 Tax=Leucobacter soli TaxID=2812850 RepID=A0A916K3J0_9MICO|nr:histidine phosphatase family protein [Leucobacter soli]CAG7620364.1 hypothetical protein LEUCIP111803_02361 [Leucobacter soli]
MRELILTRHAKSDWGDPELPDHDRPLNARGLRDAPAMADRLAATGVEVQRILSSTAVRARSTAAVFGAALGVEVELDEELYLASAAKLLTAAAGSDAGTVMVVAHDPGISDLASTLSDGGITHMPTCAVARFTWQVDAWDEAVTRPADTWGLATPR